MVSRLILAISSTEPGISLRRLFRSVKLDRSRSPWSPACRKILLTWDCEGSEMANFVEIEAQSNAVWRISIRSKLSRFIQSKAKGAGRAFVSQTECSSKRRLRQPMSQRNCPRRFIGASAGLSDPITARALNVMADLFGHLT